MLSTPVIFQCLFLIERFSTSVAIVHQTELILFFWQLLFLPLLWMLQPHVLVEVSPPNEWASAMFTFILRIRLGTNATFVHHDGFGPWHRCHFCSGSPDVDESAEISVFINRIGLFFCSFGSRFAAESDGRSGLARVGHLRKVVFTNRAR